MSYYPCNVQQTDYLSVSLCDNLVFVDSHSVDGYLEVGLTPERARELAAKLNELADLAEKEL